MLHSFFIIVKTQNEKGVIDDAYGYGRRHWGDGGRLPPVRNSGGCPPEITIFSEHFLNILLFCFSNISKIKWAKSVEKSKFLGMWF